MDSMYSSNLTFSLSPNWRFIHTEDWRKDLTGEWAECGGADQDGWVYMGRVETETVYCRRWECDQEKEMDKENMV